MRDLFERFLPDEQRVKRLGSVIKPEQILALKGNADRGRELFFKSAGLQCVNCHRDQRHRQHARPRPDADRQEVHAGPDPGEHPGAVEGHRSASTSPTCVETTDGKVYTGLLASKTDKEVVLKVAGDKEVRVPAGEGGAAGAAAEVADAGVAAARPDGGTSPSSARAARGPTTSQIGSLKENIVALCDVDERPDRRTGGATAIEAFNRYEKVPKYHDFRVMFDKQKDIDTVAVCTPDHHHAFAAMIAMKLGKNVYVEKPMAHDVWEVRQMRDAAIKYKVATQMGNQGTNADSFRRGAEIVRSGAIGDVREVHIWTNRPIWPQNISQRPKAEPVPKGLHWDLRPGTAPERPVSSGDTYRPFKRRGWWDFGTGAIGHPSVECSCRVSDGAG